VDDLIGRASDAVEAIVDRGIRAAMNEFNGDESKVDSKTRDAH
jgi:hypothetical protein